MARVKCCECGTAAERLINDEYYCEPCAPKEKITPSMPENTPVCGVDCTCEGAVEKPKTESFWGKVSKWLENYGCNCGGC